MAAILLPAPAAAVLQTLVASAGSPSSEQQLLNVLYQHGLLTDGSASSVNARPRAVAVTAWSPPSVTSAAQPSVGGGRTLPYASLQIMDKQLATLFTLGQRLENAPPNGRGAPVGVNFLRLAVELMRVVREVAVPLHRDLSTHSTHSEVDSAATAAGLRYGNKLLPVSTALHILASVFDHDRAAVSEADVGIIIQLSRDVSAVFSQPRALLKHERAFQLALAASWMALGSCVASLARRLELQSSGTLSPSSSDASGETAICVAVLRTFGENDAWTHSGSSLFLGQTYLTAFSRAIQVLVWSPLLQAAFDNTVDTAAKLIWDRIATRPPISLNRVTSARFPTLAHGIMFLAAGVKKAVERVMLAVPASSSERPPLHLYQRRTVVQLAECVRTLARSLPEGDVGLFHWLAMATVHPSEVPAGLTAEPESLISRAERTSFASFDDPPTKRVLRPTVLQALVAYIRDISSVSTSSLSDDAVLTLVEAVALELLELHVTSVVELHEPLKVVSPIEIIWRLVRARCESNFNFFAEFIKRVVMRFAQHAFQLLLVGGVRSQSEVALRFANQMYFCFGPALSWVAMEALEPSLVRNVLQCLTWLAPLLLPVIAVQPVWLSGGANASSGALASRPQRNPDRSRLEKLYNASAMAATALGARLDRHLGIALIDETKQRVAETGRYAVPLYSGHVEMLFAALRSPTLCAKVPQHRLLNDWACLVLPVLSGQHSAPAALQAAAHDCLIAPILAKRAQGLAMIPTYVSMFCPVQGVRQKYPQKPPGVVRVFAKSVRQVVENLEKMDVSDALMDEEDGMLSSTVSQVEEPRAPSSSFVIASKNLTPLSAILLIVQGVFDQIRAALLNPQQPTTAMNDLSARRELFISALVNLLQCSNPKVTSRVCTSIEVLVLDYLVQNIPFQESVLKFAADVVQSTGNFSVKKPVGEWLLKLTNEARQRRHIAGGTPRTIPQSKL